MPPTDPPSRPLSAVVLAAGEGTRMRSDRPKPLHRLCGRPMVLHVLHALEGLGVDRAVVVVGHGSDRVTKALGELPPSGLVLDFVEQRAPRGTGDALAAAMTAFDDDGDEPGDIIVAPGDTPLLRPATLLGLTRAHQATDAAATVLTASFDDPTGYGRVVRAKNGDVARIVEQADADDDQRAIQEVNTSIYVFRRSVVAPALRRLSPDNAQGEYYLTDIVGVLHDAGYGVRAVGVDDPGEVAGVNDRVQLARVEAELRRRINQAWLARGVTLVDPAQTYLDTTVRLERDVTIYPGCVLQGATSVGEGSEIGPNSQLSDCRVGAGAVVTATVGREAQVGDGARVGPWAYLPPGTAVEAGTVTGPGFTGSFQADLPAPEE